MKRNLVVLDWMKNPSRARHRHEDARAKAETKHKLRRWNFDANDGALVGKWASTHGRPCSCWMCTEREPNDKFKGYRGELKEQA
jgi:hypothetical protein